MPTVSKAFQRIGGAAVAAGLLVPVMAVAANAAPHSSAAHASSCSSKAATSTSVARLGAGVSLTTGQAGNLYPAGSSTHLLVTDPSSGPATQQVRLQVSNQTQSLGTVQASVSRPAAKAAATSARKSVKVPNRPGWYQIRAERVSGSQVLGVSCLWYGVAMPNAALNLDTLPAGKDWGGPGPLRDVALSAQLGLNVVRIQLNVDSFLANPGYADPELTQAAHRAAKLGLRFVVQIGQGAPDETAAVKNGSWGHLVRRIVTQYPAVRYWSPWNEPNAGEFFYGSVKTYIDRVLVPADKAVHAVSPEAKVVGGSAIGDDAPWWNKFAALGGFHDCDAISVNPYTSYLGAPETAGLLGDLRLVRSLAKSHGASHKPILDTESAYPSTYQGVHANLTTQADYVSRKYVLERALGVDSGEYLIEGGYQNWDIIDYNHGVKPAAMALSAASTLLAHRHFVGWVHTGKADVYAARFSAAHGSSHQLIVTWSSKGSHKVGLHGTHAGYSVFGAPARFSGHVMATGALSFLSVSAGSNPLV
jgi:hypothetical protein